MTIAEIDRRSSIVGTLHSPAFLLFSGYKSVPQHLDNRIPSITGTFLSRQAPVGGPANQNCGGKDHNDTPAASRVRGGDRAGVVSSKTPAESVNGCANTLPVMFPVSGVRAANVAHLLNYLLLPFRANRGQQEPKRLLPIILL